MNRFGVFQSLTNCRETGHEALPVCVHEKSGARKIISAKESCPKNFRPVQFVCRLATEVRIKKPRLFPSPADKNKPDQVRIGSPLRRNSPDRMVVTRGIRPPRGK